MNSAGSGLALETETPDYTHCVLHRGIFPSNGRGLARDLFLATGCKCDSLGFAGRTVLLPVIDSSVLDSS